MPGRAFGLTRARLITANGRPHSWLLSAQWPRSYHLISNCNCNWISDCARADCRGYTMHYDYALYTIVTAVAALLLYALYCLRSSCCDISICYMLYISPRCCPPCPHSVATLELPINSSRIIKPTKLLALVKTKTRSAGINFN